MIDELRNRHHSIRDAWTKIDQTISNLVFLCGDAYSRHNNQFPCHKLKSEAARDILRLRRARDAAAPGIFHDPAWDILLDLYAALHEKRDISVSSACIASAVPPTTGLRYVSSLVQSGYISRYRAGSDKRIVYVAITEKGKEIVESFFEGMASGFGFELYR